MVSQTEAKCWLSLLLIMNNEFTQSLTCVHMSYTYPWTCDSLCVCVSSRLQFHTELSPVSVSAEISVWLDLQMSHSLGHNMLRRHCTDKGNKWYLCSCKDVKPLVWYFAACCPHHSSNLSFIFFGARLCTELAWTQCPQKNSKWLSEGLAPQCMLISSSLHSRINKEAASENHPQFSA